MIRLAFIVVSFILLANEVATLSFKSSPGSILASLKKVKSHHHANDEAENINNEEATTTTMTNCVNPSEKHLRKKLAYAYTYFVQEIIRGGVFTPITDSAQENDNNDFKMNRRIVKSCLETNQTAWSRQAAKTCPYNMEKVHRVDHYPFTQLVAVCHCKEACSQLPREVSKRFGCFPDYIALPVLKRSPVCPPSGVYEFKAELEYVPISCSCREKEKRVYS